MKVSSESTNWTGSRPSSCYFVKTGNKWRDSSKRTKEKHRYATRSPERILWKWISLRCTLDHSLCSPSHCKSDPLRHFLLKFTKTIVALQSFSINSPTK